MRNNRYLKKRLDFIWSKYFSDCNRPNEIVIRFGRKARKRLGSIRRERVENDHRYESLISLNGHFVDEYIPEFVIDATIAHELVHYIQGFSSPLPRLSPFPHRGGAVDKELARRGIKWLEERESAWLNRYWLKYLSNH